MTLREVNDDLIEETTRWPTPMMHHGSAGLLAELGDDGARELFRRVSFRAREAMRSSDLRGTVVVTVDLLLVADNSLIRFHMAPIAAFGTSPRRASSLAITVAVLDSLRNHAPRAA